MLRSNEYYDVHRFIVKGFYREICQMMKGFRQGIENKKKGKQRKKKKEKKNIIIINDY